MSDNTKTPKQNFDTPLGTEASEFWNRQAKFWLGFAILFGIALWVFSPILLPFVLGAVVAYLLNPAVNLLGSWNLSRTFSTFIILGGFIVIVFTGLSLVLPIASAELLRLIKNLPAYFNTLWEASEPYRNALEDRIGEEEMAQLKSGIESSSGQLLELSQNFLNGLISSGQAAIGFISVLIIMPIVAFYMMIEWPKITRWIDSHIPQQHAEEIRGILKDIDTKLSGFIRGQLLVAFTLGAIYAIAMKLTGLKFGLIIGLLAGILSIIPLVGSTIGLIAGTAVAWFQSYDIGYVALIAGIFFAGQGFEGYFLTPKLVGDRVGLHPLWILFALMAGGALFGFVGVLIAVPVAAVISVLVSFALERYRQSDFYDSDPPPEPGSDQQASPQ